MASRPSGAQAAATESLLASKDAYKDLTYEPSDHTVKLNPFTLPDGYKAASVGVLHKRVVEAGARLAQLLEAI